MGYDTYSFEHLELFCEGKNLEKFRPPLYSSFGEHLCVKLELENYYGDMIHIRKKLFHSINSYPYFSSFCPQYVIGDIARKYVFGAKIYMGKKCFQIMVCCKYSQPHI
jgi:hypothetical protein